jgi:hypothetical protein
MTAIANIAPDTLPSDWELLCEAGRLAAEQIDYGRWIIGDLALRVHDQAAFARECNIPKRRAREYADVCAFFPAAEREAYLRDNPGITYTHFRTARKLRDIERAYRFLEHCAKRGRTTDQAERLMARLAGRKARPAPLLKDVLVEVVARRGADTFEFRVRDRAACDALYAALYAASHKGDGAPLRMTLRRDDHA